MHASVIRSLAHAYIAHCKRTAHNTLTRDVIARAVHGKKKKHTQQHTLAEHITIVVSRVA